MPESMTLPPEARAALADLDRREAEIHADADFLRAKLADVQQRIRLRMGDPYQLDGEMRDLQQRLDAIPSRLADLARLREAVQRYHERKPHLLAEQSAAQAALDAALGEAEAAVQRLAEAARRVVDVAARLQAAEHGLAQDPLVPANLRREPRVLQPTKTHLARRVARLLGEAGLALSPSPGLPSNDPGIKQLGGS